LKRLTKWFLLLPLCAVLIAPAAAVQPIHGLLMIRVQQPFPEAMAKLQQSIVKQGYTLIRVQRVDVGLTKSGYKTAQYRIVFFGKAKEVDHLAKAYPDLIPFLPLKLAIFAEGNESIVVGANPLVYEDMFPDKRLRPQFRAWSADFHKILDRMQYND
jgi:uncharacterized protein (DUF302 family)